MKKSKKINILRGLLGISLLLVVIAAGFVLKDLHRQKLFADKGKAANGSLSIEYPSLSKACSTFEVIEEYGLLGSSCKTSLDNNEGELTIDVNVYSLLMDAESTKLQAYKINAKGASLMYNRVLKEEGEIEINLKGIAAGDTILLKVLEKFKGKNTFPRSVIFTDLDIVANETP